MSFLWIYRINNFFDFLAISNRSLYDLLHNETMVIDGELVLPILRDVSQGVRFLHSANPQVIHGDLKAAVSWKSTAMYNTSMINSDF